MKDFLLSVLLVEDSDGDALLFSKQLKKLERLDIDLCRVVGLKNAVDLVSDHVFDLIIADLSLPDSEGLATIEAIRESYPDTAVIVLSGLDDRDIAIESVRMGAQDYLVKGEFTSALLEKTFMFAIERHKWQLTLKSLAIIDELTGLYNRRGFMTLAEQQIKVLKRKKNAYFLLYIDLDDFKSINDQYGHLVGDEALKSFANILRRTFRDSDILSRFGGDEFVVFISEIHLHDRQILEQRLLARIEEFNLTTHHPFRLAASYGMVYYNAEDSQNYGLRRLVEQADEQMYTMKHAYDHPH